MSTARRKTTAPRIWRIDSGAVPLDALVGVALHGDRVALSGRSTWRSRVRRSREFLEQTLRAGGVVYGVSTGVGNDSSRAVNLEAQIAFARSVMRQHGCGVGDPLSEAESRAVVFARLVSLCKGYSAVRFSLLEALASLLEKGVIPVIPRWGSVGASGDLTPLSYVASTLAGEREAWFRGRIVPSAEALRSAHLRPFDFAPKESLAIMNGTSVMTAVGALVAHRLAGVIEHAEQATALAAEILYGRSLAFHPRVHATKPHPGQVETAAKLRGYLRGSRLVDPARVNGRPVQDRYSIRCSPHVLGSVRDALDWTRRILEIELNSVNDNPMVDPESGEVFFGGNFFGSHPALAMDLLKIAAASSADLVDRQFALLVEVPHNMGLPETLVAYGGCGVKGLQITCSALTALAIQHSGPSTVLSRSTECANQDKVSMGLHSALGASDVVAALGRAVASLLIALSNAASLRDETKLSPHGRQLVREIRSLSPLLTEDRRLDLDIERVFRWVESPSRS